MLGSKADKDKPNKNEGTMPLFKKRYTLPAPPAPSATSEVEAEQRRIRRHTLVKPNTTTTSNAKANFTNESDLTITSDSYPHHPPPPPSQHGQQQDHIIGLAYPNRPYTWEKNGHAQSASATSSVEGGNGTGTGTGTETTDSLLSVSVAASGVSEVLHMNGMLFFFNVFLFYFFP